MLNVPKSGALDFVSLGALIHRLDPGIIRFAKPRTSTFMSAVVNSTVRRIWRTAFK